MPSVHTHRFPYSFSFAHRLYPFLLYFLTSFALGDRPFSEALSLIFIAGSISSFLHKLKVSLQSCKPSIIAFLTFLPFFRNIPRPDFLSSRSSFPTRISTILPSLSPMMTTLIQPLLISHACRIHSPRLLTFIPVPSMPTTRSSASALNDNGRSSIRLRIWLKLITTDFRQPFIFHEKLTLFS